MSADLFAEFSSPEQPLPSAALQPGAGHAKSPSAPAAQAWAQDPFALVGAHGASTTSPPSHPWNSPQPLAASSSSGWSSFGQPALPAGGAQTQPTDDDADDGWGDFEVAETTVQNNAPAVHVPALPAQKPPPAWPDTPVPAVDYATSSFVAAAQPRRPSPPPFWPQPLSRPGAPTTLKPTDSSVLFDADDFQLQGDEAHDEDGDEFGDFEIGARPTPPPEPAPPANQMPPPSMDLLGLDDAPTPPKDETLQQKTPGKACTPLRFGALAANYTATPNAPSFQGRHPFPDLAVETSAAAISGDNVGESATTPWSTWSSTATSSHAAKAKVDDDDDWSAWDDMPATGAGTTKESGSKGPPQVLGWDTDTAGSPSAVATRGDKDPPPTNVPPPSVILSAFPDLLNSGTALFGSMGQKASVREQVLSNPKAVQFLGGYIALAVTAARVMAGRKQRWHRDKILAKSMSISAAGSKGMKLAGVDKTQQAREDREAADVVSAWREHVGRLRSAVAVAKASGNAGLKVPELSEAMQVQTARLVPTAPKPCVICGLKREERVAKVDVDVEDSFGEWWVEHWGHRACKNFWVEHEQRLRQR